MSKTIRAQLDEALAYVSAKLPAPLPTTEPAVGLILGSGLGPFAETIDDPVGVPYDAIPGFHRSTVIGHAGKLVVGGITTPDGAKLRVMCMQGRIHSYEGHSLEEVAFPARFLVAAGCKTIILTNAAGSIDRTMRPGEIVVLRDHLNLLGGSPLRGPNDDSLGARFPDMSEVYAAALRGLATQAGVEVGLTLREAIYAALPGPNYETPAEIRMLRVLGAELVGMSTVPEAIAAVHMGASVLGLSCVTNLAAGVSTEKLSHDEVTDTARSVRREFERLLHTILGKIAVAHKKAGGP